MTDTPSDAAIVKALRRSGEPGFWTVEEIRRRADECYPAATLAHAKTLQEVSDAVEKHWGNMPCEFDRFIIPKPDPLVDALYEAFPISFADTPMLPDDMSNFHEALAKRGLKIVEDTDAPR